MPDTTADRIEDRIERKAREEWACNETCPCASCGPTITFAAIHETARQAARAVCWQCKSGKPHDPSVYARCNGIRALIPAAFEGETP
jgi:hypothetical protein